jgi:hypothetical protein
MTAAATIDFTQPREIEIDRVEVLRTGSNDGHPWTLYRVYASENGGVPIPEELRSFDALTGTVTVTAEAFVKDGAISHYTLKRVKTAAEIRERRRQARDRVVGNVRPAVDAAAPDGDRVAQLEQRVALLEAKFQTLKDLLPGGET